MDISMDQVFFQPRKKKKLRLGDELWNGYRFYSEPIKNEETKHQTKRRQEFFAIRKDKIDGVDCFFVGLLGTIPIRKNEHWTNKII